MSWGDRVFIIIFSGLLIFSFYYMTNNRMEAVIQEYKKIDSTRIMALDKKIDSLLKHTAELDSLEFFIINHLKYENSANDSVISRYDAWFESLHGSGR